MKTTMRSRRRFDVACLLALATAPAVLPSAPAADLYYLGAQYSPGPSYPAPWPTDGSWFDANLWQNSTLPSSTTNAIFGSDQTLPNGNTTHAPHTLYFGNFGYCGDTVIAGGNASAGTVTFFSDNWTFDFGSGQTPDFSGTFTPSTGVLTVGTLSLGPAAGQSTSLIIQSGTVTATAVKIATQAGQGILSLSPDGCLSTTSSTLGISGTGIFNQIGGTHTASGTLALGCNTGSVGSYTLSNGQLNTATELVGYSYGTGNFTQTGGTHSVSGTLWVAPSTNTSGYYTLSAGLLTSTVEVIGNGGAACFTQSGGTHTVGTLSVGTLGLLNLVGGTMHITDGLSNDGSLVLGGTTTLSAGGMVDLSRATLQDLSHVSFTYL